MAAPGSPTDSETLTSAYGDRNGGRLSIVRWGVEDVAAYIGSLGYTQYEQVFIDNQVTGEALIHFDHEHLREMGIKSLGHRLTILKSVYNIKIQDEVPIEPEHYVPSSADAQNAGSNNAPATQGEIDKLIVAILQRDEKIQQVETELKKVQAQMESMREQFLPLVASIKQNQPLPTPQPTSRPIQTDTFSSNSTPMSYSALNSAPMSYPEPLSHKEEEPPQTSKPLARKQSRRGLFSSGNKSKSPTHPTHPETPGYPTSQSITQPYSNNLTSTYGAPSPTSPVPTISQQSSHRPERDYSDVFNSGPQTTPKSFRVSMEDPCEKVLPAALRRYNIVADWRQYSLYIVYGDQERCLDLNEKPLILFKQLDKEGKKPMFMLRRKATDVQGAGTQPGREGGITLPGGII